MARIGDPVFVLTGKELEVVCKWIAEHPHGPTDTREVRISADGYDVIVTIIETDVEEEFVEEEFRFNTE
jgi:hypothetical protein